MNIPPISFARPQRDFKQSLQTTNVDAQDHSTEVPALFEQGTAIECVIESCPVQATTGTVSRPTQCSIKQDVNDGTQWEPQLLDEDQIREILVSKELKQFCEKQTPLLKNALIGNHIGDS